MKRTPTQEGQLQPAIKKSVNIMQGEINQPQQNAKEDDQYIPDATNNSGKSDEDDDFDEFGVFEYFF